MKDLVSFIIFLNFLICCGNTAESEKKCPPGWTQKMCERSQSTDAIKAPGDVFQTKAALKETAKKSGKTVMKDARGFFTESPVGWIVVAFVIIGAIILILTGKLNLAVVKGRTLQFALVAAVGVAILILSKLLLGKPESFSPDNFSGVYWILLVGWVIAALTPLKFDEGLFITLVFLAALAMTLLPFLNTLLHSFLGETWWWWLVVGGSFFLHYCPKVIKDRGIRITVTMVVWFMLGCFSA